MNIKFNNIWTFTVRNPDGSIIKEFKIKNLITNEGLNDVLSKYWKGAAYTAAFYVGLIDNASFVTLAVTDTAAQIGGTNGWIESVAYTEGVRQTLTLGAVASQSVNNAAALATFTANANFTLKGGFVGTSNVKGGTAGVLVGEATDPMGGSAIISGQSITVQITITDSN